MLKVIDNAFNGISLVKQSYHNNTEKGKGDYRNRNAKMKANEFVARMNSSVGFNRNFLLYYDNGFTFAHAFLALTNSD